MAAVSQIAVLRCWMGSWHRHISLPVALPLFGRMLMTMGVLRPWTLGLHRIGSLIRRPQLMALGEERRKHRTPKAMACIIGCEGFLLIPSTQSKLGSDGVHVDPVFWCLCGHLE